MLIPKNIKAEHIEQAISRIDQEGVPANAHSSTYDLIFKGKSYPPKLVISWANVYANGEELDRSSFSGGLGHQCFKLLEREGFVIHPKGKQAVHMIDIYPTIQKFLAQAKTTQLTTADFISEAYGLKVKVSFGQGNLAEIPWVSFLYEGQKTSQGIYPVYLLYKEKNTLFLVYGISEENDANLMWSDIDKETVGEFSQKNFGTQPSRYSQSPYFKAYDLNLKLNQKQINKDLKNLVDEYKAIFENSPIISEPKPTQEYSMDNQSLNTILYGPPGTGKTYITTEKAVSIIDGKWSGTRDDLKERYDELVKEGRIQFCTFHQSFSYEDFVEGIRPKVEGGTIDYPIEDGIFKNIVLSAKTKRISKVDNTAQHEQSTIWKMSLGNTLGTESEIYDEAIELNRIILGWGWDIDFSGCDNIKQIREKFAEKRPDLEDIEYATRAVNIIKNTMKVGDLVIISDGNHKFRAIGRITGDYFYSPRDNYEDYMQCREVKWLKQLEPSLPYQTIMDKAFSQMTLYKMGKEVLNKEKLYNFLNNKLIDITDESKKYVLIIDEINRGNISRIFGELITLLEPSKRDGGEDARTAILPYSKEEFSVPSNLHVMGTMNTADRSLAKLDIALRRRFQFEEILPMPELLDGIQIQGIDIRNLFSTLNERIEVLLGRDYMLGHSYFMGLSNDSKIEELATIIENSVIPLLQEYFYDDWQRISWVLNGQIVKKKNGKNIENIFPNMSDSSQITDNRWVIDTKAFSLPNTYKNIISAETSFIDEDTRE